MTATSRAERGHRDMTSFSMLTNPRAFAGGLGALAAVMLVLPPSPAMAGQAARCESKGATTLTANRSVRVFQRRQAAYACAYTSGRTVRLSGGVATGCADFDGCSGARHFVVAGRFVAYSVVLADRGFARETLFVVDMRTGRRTQKWRYGIADPAAARSGTIGSVVLASTGDIAWISDKSDATSVTTEVHIDTGGGDIVVDSSPSGPIESESLALSGNARVFWIRDGQPRQASLADATN